MNASYELMNKDRIVLAFTADAVTDSFELDRPGDTGPLPIGFTDVYRFLDSRRAPKHRAHIARLLSLCQCDTLCGYLDVTRALSLTDTFWCRPTGSCLTWRDVSLFANPFDAVIAHLAFEGGLYGEMMSTTSPEFGTDGSFAKCWVRDGQEIYLLKTGSRTGAEASWEPWSEVMAFQLALALGIDAVPYRLVTWRGHSGAIPASACPLFTSEDFGFVPMSRYMGSPASPLPELLETYKKVGSEDQFRRMLVLDALALNPDRHMGNHGLLVENDTLEPVSMAPVFDNNLAFCPGLSDKGVGDVLGWARQSLRPKVGGDFNLVADAVMTPAIRRDVRELRDFAFDRSALPGMPGERVDALEAAVRAQARAVLAGERFNLAPEEPGEDLSWQLEGWPGDPVPGQAVSTV